MGRTNSYYYKVLKQYNKHKKTLFSFLKFKMIVFLCEPPKANILIKFVFSEATVISYKQKLRYDLIVS